MNKDLGKALGILANPVICSRLNHPCYLSVYMGESEWMKIQSKYQVQCIMCMVIWLLDQVSVRIFECVCQLFVSMLQLTVTWLRPLLDQRDWLHRHVGGVWTQVGIWCSVIGQHVKIKMRNHSGEPKGDVNEIINKWWATLNLKVNDLAQIQHDSRRWNEQQN